MTPIAFDTDVIPSDRRLAVFQSGAAEFQVRAIGDPATFGARWRMLVLGDLNLIHAHCAPVGYRRDEAMIAADGEDRITLHCYLKGEETGVIEDRPVRAGPGSMMVWDLTRPFDIHSPDPIELIIITLPRYMVDEVLPSAAIAGPVAPSPELALAVDHARQLLDHADKLPEPAAVFLGRALRDMFAVAMLPAFRQVEQSLEADAPLLQRLTDLIDAALPETVNLSDAAATLRVKPAALTEVAERVGGLDLLAERRRLLRAYRFLSDPRETDTVLGIARRCGFDSLPRFSRRFRTVFHTSARDLRSYGRGRLPRWAGAYHVEMLYRPLLAS